MGDTIAQIRFENVSKTSYDSPLRGVNTPQSDEDSMQLKELIEIVLMCYKREEVFAGHDMADHKVNVVEKEVSAADLVTTAGEVVTTASVDISTASVPITVSTATPTTPPTTTTEDDMTLAETLMEIKSAKPKAIGVVMQEPSEIPRISAAQQ
ncbi:hypothetical protein Tco_1091833 [Tanacetum coccineum]|uniref:Uncharacterized protein n=1 Tax=Tanacetum coccineum TaxID=301880 RepID=A0ABQ5I9H2_9ASTR